MLCIAVSFQYLIPFSFFLSFVGISELFLEPYENISILFADICKFTEMTTTLSVDKLVETLNDLFGKFDDAADVSESPGLSKARHKY